MSPNSQIIIAQPDSRAWWLPEVDYNAKLTKFYNEVIAPKDMFVSLRVLTRFGLKHILEEPLGINQFEDFNHIITHDVYLVTRHDDRSFVMCRRCSHTLYRESELKHIPHKLQGSRHTVFPRLHVKYMPHLNKLWCAKCQVKQFTWMSALECRRTSPFHTYPF